MCSKSYAQLRATFEEYETASGHTIEEALDKEFSGDLLKTFLAIGNYLTKIIISFNQTVILIFIRFKSNV